MKKMTLWVLPLLLIFGSLACLAQSTNSGDIRGSVTDSTGALIPDVTVTVLNVDTGVSKDFTTNQDGLYDTISIVTGSYKVTFTKDGFEKLVRGPITLQVGFTTVNAELKVGAATQDGDGNRGRAPAARPRPANRAPPSKRSRWSNCPRLQEGRA